VQVLLAKSAGFCFGVRRAVDRAMEAADHAPHPLYTDGPLIHNPTMLEELRHCGIEIAEDPAALAPGTTLILRAHGISPEHRQRLKQLPVHLVDATCPEVAHIQGSIRAHVAKGFTVLIHGDAGHAEVIGLLGHAQGRGVVVAGAEKIPDLPPIAGPVCLVAQSTQDVEAFARTAEAVRKRFLDAVVLDTICEATKNRQSEISDLAARCEKIVVVGSTTSANSLRLAEIAVRFRPTLLVQSETDLHPSDFSNIQTVGLTAGASTPDATLQAVRRRLQSFNEPSA